MRKEETALNSNRLKDKSIRFKSHKDINHLKIFWISVYLRNLYLKVYSWNRNLQLEIMIKSLQAHGLQNWNHFRLHWWRTSLLTAIKNGQTKQNRETETDLENVIAKEEYFQAEETINTNEAKTKCLLHQRKFKKFKRLKYKRETTREKTLQPT